MNKKLLITLYIIILAIILIPFNIITATEYHNLVRGTNCKVNQVNSCNNIVSDSYSKYDCNLDVNCYDTNMNIQIILIIIPNVNGSVYNSFDDEKNKSDKLTLIVINTVVTFAILILVPALLMLYDGYQLIYNNKNSKKDNNNDEIMLVIEGK